MKHRFLLVASTLIAFFWIIESVVHAFVFHEGNLIGHIFTSDFHEIWTRTVTIVTIILFSIYANFIVKKREESERKLRKEHDFSMNLLETAQVIILVLDTNGRIVTFNPYMEQVSGYKLDEVKGRDWFTTFLPECDYDKIRNLFKKAIDNVRTLGNVNPIVTRDGREIQIEWYDKTLKDTDGRTRGLLSVGRDITERKRAEKEIRKFRIIADRAEYGSAIVDLQGNIAYINDYFARTHGYASDELYGRNLSLFHNEKQMETVRKINESLIEKGNFGPMEVWHTHKDGTEFPMLMSGVVILDESGKPENLATLAVDITERKLMEESLRKSEENFSKVADYSYNWEYWVNPKGKFIYVSPSCKRITGYSANEFIQNPELLLSIVHSDDVDHVKDHKHKARETGDICPIEFRIITRKGEERWIGHVCRTVYDNNGLNLGQRGSNRDITKQKIMESIIKNNSRDLEIAVRKKENEMAILMERYIRQEKLAAIGQISGNIAHEIRNPLSAVKQSVYFLKRKMNTYPAKIQEHLELMDRQLAGANDVITNMVTMVRSSTSSDFKLIDLHKVIRESVTRCRPPERTRIDVDFKNDALEVFADPLQLQQLMVNLISNAIHAIPEEGNIKIDVQYPDENGMCRIKIRDNGTGIEPEILDKVYDPLFTTKGDGTGLGLGICKHVMEKHNGDMHIESEVDHGTTVTIVIPMEKNLDSNGKTKGKN